jgi:hypothetical protein
MPSADTVPKKWFPMCSTLAGQAPCGGIPDVAKAGVI